MRKHEIADISGGAKGLVVIDCATCSFRHLSPIPDDSYYYSGGFYRDLKPLYAAEYEQDSEWWEMIYADWLAMLLDAPGNSILDVGAGTGLFIKVAKHLGWNGAGVDPDYDMARKHNLIYGGYQNIGESMRGLGVITAHWVLEHLPDPHHFVQWAYDLLSPGGLLMLAIPNEWRDIQFQAARVANKPFYWLDETHINYFDRDSLRNLLRSYGFQIINSRAYGSWTPERHIISGLNYLDDPALGRKLHKARMRHELAMSMTNRRRMMQIK